MLKLALPLVAVALLAACEAPMATAPATSAAPTATAAAAPVYGFDGKWDCEGQTFTFTGTTYQPGAGAPVLRMSKVEKFGTDTFGLTFPDGTAIGLMAVTPTSMTWSSPATGDMLECRRTW